MVIDTSKWLSGSWKTTAFGLISAAAGFIILHPQYFVAHAYIVDIANYVLMGGLAGLGLSGKDSNVTGGTTPNSTNNPLVVAQTSSGLATPEQVVQAEKVIQPPKA